MKITALSLALAAALVAPALAGGMTHASPKPSPAHSMKSDHMMTSHHMTSHHMAGHTMKSGHMMTSHHAMSSHHMMTGHEQKKPTPKPSSRP